MTLALLTTLASVASLVGLAYQLYQHKEKPFTYFLLGVSFVCAIVAAGLWVETNQLEQEKEALLNARLQADKLIKTWPEKNNLDFVSAGEFRGIVHSGLAFLEAHQALFPDTYSSVKSVSLVELEAASNNDDNYVSKRSKLREAAEMMITTIKSIRLATSKS